LVQASGCTAWIDVAAAAELPAGVPEQVIGQTLGFRFRVALCARCQNKTPAAPQRWAGSGGDFDMLRQGAHTASVDVWNDEKTQGVLFSLTLISIAENYVGVNALPARDSAVSQTYVNPGNAQIWKLS
jgi:hypothetical protein